MTPIQKVKQDVKFRLDIQRDKLLKAEQGKDYSKCLQLEAQIAILEDVMIYFSRQNL